MRVRYSGVNPGDTKKRRGWLGSTMPFPRVIPHSDAAGVIDRVGDGVSAARVVQRVWVYGAQSYRPFGAAAEFTAQGAIKVRTRRPVPVDAIAKAHELVDAGTRERVLLSLPE